MEFTPVEYFSIAVFSLTIIASLSDKSLMKGLLSGLLGIAISMVGMAPLDGVTRFAFGQYQLLSGFSICCRFNWYFRRNLILLWQDMEEMVLTRK